MDIPHAQSTREAVADIGRQCWGRVLSALIYSFRDFELAEDALQDALLVALEVWPKRGVPDNPRAWLLKTARNKALDRLRRLQNFKNKQAELAVLQELEGSSMEAESDHDIPDERLRLIFTCCHPALRPSARIAMTLKTLGGLSTGEIAKAYLVPETTMAQRITRAKRKISAAGIPYEIPGAEQIGDRLATVLTVIYLIFNEGHSATSGADITRADLCGEAIRLVRVLPNLLPNEPEVTGLLAIMLLSDARRPAREANPTAGLDEQDRSLWLHGQIGEAKQLLQAAMGLGDIGPYQIQAAINAVHSEARRYEDTDWQEIYLLYGRLYALQPTDIVRLNQVVALSYWKSADSALPLLDELLARGELKNYQPFYAALADIYHRSGQAEPAFEAYTRAIELTDNAGQKSFLKKKLKKLFAN